MAPLLSPRPTDPRRSDAQARSASSLRLRATQLSEDEGPRAVEEPSTPTLAWPVVAIVGGMATAAISWVCWVGIAMLGWLSADPGTFGDAVQVGNALWLLTNGVSVQFGTIPVTLVPWAATAFVAFLISRSAALAARLVRPDSDVGPGLISVATVASYLVPVLATAVLFGQPWQAPGHWAAVIAVLAGAAAWGSSRELRQSLLPSWPAWSRAIPAAVLSTQLVMLGAGAAVMITGLWRHLDRVTLLHQALDPGVAGGIALLIGQLAFAPNACVWAASYALGAGFSVGTGSVVAPAGSEIGILPGIPIFGAMPAVGPGSALLLWWLAAGVLAGAVAAWLVVRARPTARFDEASLVGGLSGLLGGAVFTGLGWAASGALGTLRLVDLGPRLLPLLVMAMTTMGLAGLITGLLLGLVGRSSRRRRTSSDPAGDAGDEPDADEPTAVLRRGADDAAERTTVLTRRGPTG